MCRNLPEALVGRVGDEEFSTFCDRLDSWLELWVAELNRHQKRAITSKIIFYFFLCLCMKLVFGLGTGSSWHVLLLLLGTVVSIWSLVWYFTPRPNGALSRYKVVHKIRAECDNMTRQNPNLSFHVVMSEPNNSFEYVKYIDYIAVDVALSTQDSGVASVPEVIVRGVDDTTIKIDNDENESDTDTEAETMSSTSSGDAAMELV
jgi:hypothetical protein